MSKRKINALAAALLCILLLVLSAAAGLVGPATAMESTNYAVNWDAMGGCDNSSLSGPEAIAANVLRAA